MSGLTTISSISGVGEGTGDFSSIPRVGEGTGDSSSISRVGEGEGTGDFSGSELGLGCSDRARRQASLLIAGTAATPASTSWQRGDPHSGGLIISSRQRIGKGTGHSPC